MRVRHLVPLTALLLAAPALAQDAPPGPAEWEPIRIEHIPPRTSSELGMTMGWASLPYWKADDVPSWGAIGFRGGFGGHLGDHRLSGSLGVVIQGPAPVHMTSALEMLGNWDFVSNSAQVGASLGPALLWHSKLQTFGSESAVGLSPVVAARIGWSEPYSAVARRVFAVLEPKLHVVEGRPAPSVSVFIGTGMGR